MADQLPKDIEYLLSLEGTVLLNIDPYLIDEENGAIVITCADGRYFSDIFMHHDRIQRNCRESPLIHPLSRHGGALVLAPDSPLVKPGSTMQKDLLGEIVEAMNWIKIKKIVLSAHYRCGKAASCNIGAAETIRLLFEAKKIVKTELASSAPVVSCYFHVDYSSEFSRYGKKKQVLSYYASREGWEKTQNTPP